MVLQAAPAGGELKMGRAGGDQYEQPLHKVFLLPFHVDRTEVTNRAYGWFVHATGHTPPEHWVDGKLPPGGDRLPVVNVAWDDAREFCRWAGKRLPSEAEWEFAARNGGKDLYPWGGEWQDGRSNSKLGPEGAAKAVGSFPKGNSAAGVKDLLGNVWEWTASQPRRYAGSKAPPMPCPGGTQNCRILRGHSYFNSDPRELTATFRIWQPKEMKSTFIGFRCARSFWRGRKVDGTPDKGNTSSKRKATGGSK